jgi:Pyruvate/2-oxoacid:ferredoxin oxidoreductase delta subunit
MALLTLKRLSWLALAAVFFPADLFKKRPRIPLPNQRFDERDAMFSRLARKPDTPQYEDYYNRHPELTRVDDRLRGMTRLAQPGSRYFKPELAQPVQSLFDHIPDIAVDRSHVSVLVKRVRSARNKPEELRLITLELGAVGAGFTNVPDSLRYSHLGRTDERYGNTPDGTLRHGLIFLVEMDYQRMQQAPKMIALYESARQYHIAAVIAKTLAAVLDELGYDTEAQYDECYSVIMPPLAVLAGLGELGRNNILIADKYGSRVRIGAVLTNMNLPQSPTIDLGVEHFCSICKKCATTCPSKSLNIDEKEEVRGIRLWSTNVERCSAYWRLSGSDCGICMAVCPYSHKSNVLHHSVRFMIRLSPWMRHLAKWADDLIYGKTWKVTDEA